jgi:hypothetical protein
MTLLSIANAVADEVKGPRPATIINNADPSAQSILRLINRVGYGLMLQYPWQILGSEKTFTASGTETALAASSMPADFNRFIPETMWDRDSNNLISGPVRPVEWAGLKAATYTSQNKKFIYRGGAILTSPVLDSGVNVAFEYTADTWVDIAATGTPKNSMTIDTDITRLDEELVISAAVYAYLDADGQPSGTAYQRFLDIYDAVSSNDQARDGIMVPGDIFALNSRHFDGTPKPSRSSYGGDF